MEASLPSGLPDMTGTAPVAALPLRRVWARPELGRLGALRDVAKPSHCPPGFEKRGICSGS